MRLRVIPRAKRGFCFKGTDMNISTLVQKVVSELVQNFDLFKKEKFHQIYNILTYKLTL